MLQRIKKMWLEALRGGEYKQGNGQLRTYYKTEYGQEKENFCCLGVLADLFSKETGTPWVPHDENSSCPLFKMDKEAYYLPPKVVEWAGIDHDEVMTRLHGLDPMVNVPEGTFKNCEPDGKKCVSVLNDEGATFTTIADYIEETF